MKQYRTTAFAAIAAAVLAVGASAALAHSGGMGEGRGQGMGMGGGMGHGMQGMHGGMGGGMHGGQGGGMHRGGGMGGAGQQLMTPEERDAVREKMRAAKTPEERQALMAATRTEMEKRAKDKGITLPEHRGHGMGAGHGQDPAAPAR